MLLKSSFYKQRHSITQLFRFYSKPSRVLFKDLSVVETVTNPDYRRLTHQIARIRARLERLDIPAEEREQLLNCLKKAKNERSLMPLTVKAVKSPHFWLK